MKLYISRSWGCSHWKKAQPWFVFANAGGLITVAYCSTYWWGRMIQRKMAGDIKSSNKLDAADADVYLARAIDLDGSRTGTNYRDGSHCGCAFFSVKQKGRRSFSGPNIARLRTYEEATTIPCNGICCRFRLETLYQNAPYQMKKPFASDGADPSSYASCPYVALSIEI